MTGLEWFSGIIRLALDELAQWNRDDESDYWQPLRPEDVTEIIIDPARHYRNNAWLIYCNWESKTPKYMCIRYVYDALYVDDL